MENMENNNDEASFLNVDLNIVITSVCAAFNTGGAINLKKIPSKRVTKKKSLNVLNMKLKNFKPTIIIRTSGKISIMGADNEEEALLAAKRTVSSLISHGIDATLNNFRIVNMWATSLLPWRIQIEPLVMRHQNLFEYEPELSNQCSIKNEELNFANIQPSGHVHMSGLTREAFVNGMTKIFSLVYEFRV